MDVPAASTDVQPHAVGTMLEPLPPDRSVLSSLFCRRCFTYDCPLHVAVLRATSSVVNAMCELGGASP